MGMRVSCLQDNLARGLGIVSRAVSTRTTLPVLANVLLATDNGRLRLSATNLELSITAWIGASVEEDGAITVPARTLNDLVNTLSPERVDMEVSVRNQTLGLACGATTANIKGIDPHEFPPLPEPGDEDGVLGIPADVMRETINLVALSAARDDSRPVLTGVLMTFHDGILTMAAADGFRLSVREVSLEVDYYDEFSIIVPYKTLTELARIIPEDDEYVYLILPEERSQVIFHMSNVDVITQTIEGAFPDYHRIIPQDLMTHTVLDTPDVLRACKRADIFAREANHTIRLSIEPQDGMAGVVRVKAQSSETGDNEGILTAAIEGEGVEIAFNVRYMIEVLSVIRQDRIVLNTSTPDKPGVLRPVGDDSFTHVIMPMHIGR